MLHWEFVVAQVVNVTTGTGCRDTRVVELISIVCHGWRGIDFVVVVFSAQSLQSVVEWRDVVIMEIENRNGHGSCGGCDVCVRSRTGHKRICTRDRTQKKNTHGGHHSHTKEDAADGPWRGHNDENKDEYSG